MPGQGRAVEHAYWYHVSATVWGYRLGRYQVLKKWLSYRERGVLGRALSAEERTSRTRRGGWRR